MSLHWALPFKIIYSVVISCIFVIPALIGYGLRIEITRKSFWVLGFYGAIVFLFIFLQLTFATFNRILVNRYKRTQPIAVSSLAFNKLSAQKSSIDVVISPTSNEKQDIMSTTHIPLTEDLTSTTLSTSSTANDSNPAVDNEKQLPTFSNNHTQKTRAATKMGLAVVGYREDATLFRQCLESIKQLHYPDPFKIVAVVDGDEDADKEMSTVFQEVFPNCPVVVLPELISVTFQQLKKSGGDMMTEINHDAILRDRVLLPTDTTPVCYLQPHRGKRHAMYTAFRVLLASGCDAVMSTDSDTKFDPRAMLEMEHALYWYPNIGAAAGDVRIWNSKDSMLSYMSSLRYWMAFNIERAAQSLNRCVTCVSGPMGVYQGHVLRQILDEWITQTFLGMECTYGDDRHLTNRALLKGYRVVYTHLAFCETETPIHFLRWFKQQTRWSKSFYRELFWNARSFHKHSPWMAAELFYQGIYPFVLLFSIFQILFAKTPFVLCVWLISLVAIACIKTVYSCVVTLSLRFLVFPVYSLYYMFGLVPAKLWAIISLWDVGWGTSARSAAEMKRENMFWLKLKEALPVVLWICLLMGSVVYNIVAFVLNTDRVNGADFFGIGQGTSIDPNSIIFYPNPDNNI